MKKHIIVAVLVALFAISSSHAQNKIESGVIVKKLFFDYGTFNDGPVLDFQDWNGGFEIGYTAYFNDKWSIAVPIKISEVKLPESVYNSRFIGLDVQVQHHLLGRTRKINPYLSAGIGFMSENGDSSHAALPLAFGFQIPVGQKTDLNAEVAYRLAFSDNRDNLNIGLGFVHRFGKVVKEEVEMPKKPSVLDSDGDGIADDVDLCPQKPGLEAFFGCPDTDADGIQDDRDDCPEQPGPRALNGCPDTDKDGVSDKNDECPNLAGTIENKGCPESPMLVDTDRDGILDKDDDCPNQAGTIANRGCPEVKKVMDRDGDGVNDDVDRCPDSPGPGFLSGCPDTDGDGLADYEDDCPNAAGSRNARGCPDTDGDGVSDKDDRCITTPGPVSNLGCPELKQADRETLEFAVQAVEFDFGKATLRNESFSILNRIADIMKRYPEYKLRITGHTDNVGNDNRNRELSERRARSCYEYLSTRGISVSRMSYSGMGEVRPIGSNDTEEGRSRNRRVEFDVYVN